MSAKSLLEVQFPIAQLSLESFLERDARTGKVLNTLGKWWGTKPVVLTRAVILGALFEASDEPERWPEDLEIFLKLMCFDNAGMWKRRIPALDVISAKPPYPRFATLCHAQARPDEMDLFRFNNDGEVYWAVRMGALDLQRRESLEKRVFYTLDHAVQRRYCKRVEEVDGPPEESWAEINAYCATTARTLQEWVSQMSQRRYGHQIRVGDAFSGMGSIPFEAAELGCDVYASDLNPVACLLTWGALNVIAGSKEFHSKVLAAQERVYREMDEWYVQGGLETSEERWRATLYFYCVEITVPEWDGWRIPVSGTWQMLRSDRAVWVELVPVEAEKRFDFKVHEGGKGYVDAAKGTKVDQDIVCPAALWDILHRTGKTDNASRSIKLNALIQNHGGLRRWEKMDFVPRADDFYGERLYCIRWEKKRPTGRPLSVFREPLEDDLRREREVTEKVAGHLGEWQEKGWIPDWRIQDGEKTRELIRTRGWSHWHHLFTPRQLLMAAEYSQRIAKQPKDVRPALVLNLGNVIIKECVLIGT
jgi:adenine-specific DNA methylase